MYPPASRVGRLAAVAATGLSLTVPAVAHASHASALATTPFVRLMTQSDSCKDNKVINSLTGSALTARISGLRSWYVHFSTQSPNNFPFGKDCEGTSSTTLADKLAASAVWVSNYRNGSYTNQGSFVEAPDLEQHAPLGIATFWPPESIPHQRTSSTTSSAARLVGAVRATDNRITVSAVPSALRPSGTGATYPWVASRGSGATAGAHSHDTHNFVSWLRVDNELMQIIGAPTLSGGNVVIPVHRALWGTGAAGHSGGARVLAPVYTGSSAVNPRNQGLGGSPSENNVNQPLRYTLKVWTGPAYGWLAGRIKSTFGQGYQGYNAVWLDTTSCVQFNESDANGHAVVMWDDRAQNAMTSDAWGTAQATKLTALRKLLPGLRLVANNESTGTCNQNLMAHYVDGAVHEFWMGDGFGGTGTFASAMPELLAVAAHNWPAIYWARWDRAGGKAAQYQRLTYGSLLLAWRSTDTRVEYGGPFGLNQPTPLFRWRFGTPATNPTALSQLSGGNGLYQRVFSNGLVLVNPSGKAVTRQLAGVYYNVLQQSGGQPAAVRAVTVPAHDAVFLVKST